VGAVTCGGVYVYIIPKSKHMSSPNDASEHVIWASFGLRCGNLCMSPVSVRDGLLVSI